MRLKNKEGKNPRILVVGDVILDKYIHGTTTRISPEAPVPIIAQTHDEYRLGGAANVASNVASVGVDVTLLGATGDDVHYHIIKRLCGQKNIKTNFLNSLGMTTVKTRIISDGQQIARIDREDLRDVALPTFADSLDYDLIIVSDYAKGMITDELIGFLLGLNIPVIVDPKPKNLAFYDGAFLMTPNRKEFDQIRSYKMTTDHLLITDGAYGMFLHEGSICGSGLHIPSEAQEVFDVTGAGDTVIAIIGVCLASQIDLLNACKIANKAAAITVSHHGTSTISKVDLETCHQETMIRTR